MAWWCLRKWQRRGSFSHRHVEKSGPAPLVDWGLWTWLWRDHSRAYLQRIVPSVQPVRDTWRTDSGCLSSFRLTWMSLRAEEPNTSRHFWSLCQAKERQQELGASGDSTQDGVSDAKRKEVQRGFLWTITACKIACVYWGVLKATSKASAGSHSEKSPVKCFASGQSRGSVHAEVKSRAEL